MFIEKRKTGLRETVVELDGGRRVGVADFGPANGDPVLWCHGGPLSRLEPTYVAERAAREGWRLIGIDGPGYGDSEPEPGRTISGWVSTPPRRTRPSKSCYAGWRTGPASGLRMPSKPQRARDDPGVTTAPSQRQRRTPSSGRPPCRFGAKRGFSRCLASPPGRPRGPLTCTIGTLTVPSRFERGAARGTNAVLRRALTTGGRSPMGRRGWGSRLIADRGTDHAFAVAVRLRGE